MLKRNFLDSSARKVLNAEPEFREGLAARIRWTRPEPVTAGFYYVRAETKPEAVKVLYLGDNAKFRRDNEFMMHRAFGTARCEFLGPFKPEDLICFVANKINVERWNEAGAEADRVLREVQDV